MLLSLFLFVREMIKTYNAGLVLEGGGNRGIYTSGVLDAFIESGIEFPYIIGVSAGSCNAASYMGKNFRRQHDITINYCNDKRFMSLGSCIKNGQYLNLEWVFGELCYDIMPLNYEEYEKSGAVFCVVVSNAETGKAEYIYPKSLREFGCAQLKASSAMPIATNGVDMDGVKYFDGGVTDSIPLKRAFEDGCRKAVVILTQDRDFVKKPVKAPQIIRRTLKKYPLLAEALIDRHNMYNAQRRYVEEQEKMGNIFVIRPARPLNCSSVEKDTNKLEVIYQLGYQQGKKNIDKIREFLAD